MGISSYNKSNVIKINLSVTPFNRMFNQQSHNA